MESDASSGLLRLTGRALPEAYQTILRSLRYENPTIGASTVPRTVVLRASDGRRFGPEARVIIYPSNPGAPAVQLDSFSAVANAMGGVDVRCATLAESEGLGFSFLRSSGSGGDREIVPTEPIAGRGNAQAGANYSYRDVEPGLGYTTYWLEAVGDDGVRQVIGRASVNAGVGVLYLPAVLR